MAAGFFRSRVVIIACGAILVIAAMAWHFALRPVFWSGGGPAAPDRFKAGVTGTAFVEASAEAGFKHVHHKPVLDSKLEPIMSWVSSVGAAAAAGDFDGDGWVDLYVTDSRKGLPNFLYRNQGDGTFADAAEQAGLAKVNGEGGVSMDAVWGDYDNDGRLDLYLAKWGRNQLFRNNGDGTFSDVSSSAFQDGNGRPGAPWDNSCSAVWVDYDLDGRLDIYVGNYFAPFDLWNLKTTRIMHDDFEKARNAGRNSLYRNNGDGTFTDTAAELGVDDVGWTLSVGHGDIDNDGRPDLYSANDFGTDQVFLNCGGTFRNITRESFGEDTKKGMNVDFGDYDGDGWLDIYVTNITTEHYLKEGNMLWYNDGLDEEGLPLFFDVSAETMTFDGGWGWGGKFFDYDNDGDLDILTVNGFISAGEGNYWYDLASWTVTEGDVADALAWPPIGDRSFSGYEATRLFRNDADQIFTEVAATAGMDDRGDGRGAVVFDYDNDGDLDVYLANQGQKPTFFRNDVGGGGHWLALRLIGRPEAGSNRDAVGARVTLVTSDQRRQIRELDGGNSFCGQSDRRIFFGLGGQSGVETLEIRWPSRRIQVLHGLRADQFLEIEEPDVLPEAVSIIPQTRLPGEMRAPAVREAPAPVLPPAERDALLSGFEERLRQHPTDLVLACKYRRECTRLDEHQRAVGFFERLTREHPDIPNVRLQLSAAYVDKIPTCGGMAAVVCKGTLARRSLDQMDMLLAENEWWPAVYSRAVNHLHWPRALLHSAASARDFRKLIEVQSADGGPNARPYYVRAYIGLGDALVKDGRFEEAHEAWQEGLKLFPGNRELEERAALASADSALEFVEKVRNLEEPIDTDFSFLLSP